MNASGRRFLGFAVPIFLLCVAATVPYLREKGYWLLDVEVGFVSLGAGVLASLLGLTALGSIWVFRFAFAILVYWVFDFYFFESAWSPAMAGLAAFGALCSRFELNIRIMGSAFSALFVAGVFLSPAPVLLDAPLQAATSSPPSDLPPIVHLVLDEHGPPNIDAEGDSAATQRRIIRDYVDRGFVVYSNTRASAASTQISLGRMMNFANDGNVDTYVSRRKNGFDFSVRKNAYFRLLREKGYAVTVVQNGYLNLCKSAQEGCHTYSRAGNGHAVADLNGRWVDRLLMVWLQWSADVSSGDTVRHVALYNSLPWPLVGPMTTRQYWTRPATVLMVLDELETHLSSTPLRGRAVVVHLLLPHFPYVLAPNCQLKPHSQWQTPMWNRSYGAPPAGRAEIEKAYWEQAACLHDRVATLIDAVQSQPESNDAIFILHGDHGTRLLGKHGNTTALAPQQALDALFAVKAPGLVAGRKSDRSTLQHRFKTVAHGLPTASSDPTHKAIHGPLSRRRHDAQRQVRKRY